MKDAVQLWNRKLIQQNGLLMRSNSVRIHSAYNECYPEIPEEYFIDGDETSLNLWFKRFAEMTGLDISTISRVANSKYIQTHFVFSLSSFSFQKVFRYSGEEYQRGKLKEFCRIALKWEEKEAANWWETHRHSSGKGYQIARLLLPNIGTTQYSVHDSERRLWKKRKCRSPGYFSKVISVIFIHYSCRCTGLIIIFTAPTFSGIFHSSKKNIIVCVATNNVLILRFH